MGALFPGLILGVLYILYVLISAYLFPKLAPAPKDAPPISFAIVFDVLRSVVLPLLLIVAVLGSIFSGIATTTEASGIGAAGALLLALFRGRLNFQVMHETLVKTTRTTAFIFGIFLGATAFSIVLRNNGGDEVIWNAIEQIPFGNHGKVIVILCFVFLLGFILDWIEISLIILPLIKEPILGMGFSLVWFTIMFAVCLQTSFLTPPVGFSLFYIRNKNVCRPEFGIGIGDIYKGVVPFIIIQVVVLAAIFYWEELVTWLPAYVEAAQRAGG